VEQRKLWRVDEAVHAALKLVVGCATIKHEVTRERERAREREAFSKRFPAFSFEELSGDQLMSSSRSSSSS
jgi:hypothetical protein